MKFVIGSLGIVLAGLLYQSATAGIHSGCCDTCSCACEKCGCQECDTCCKLVCETKKVTKVKYCCKCEEFCVPHENCCRIEHETCEQCNSCNCDCCNKECAAEKWLTSLFHHDNSTASCADALPKKKLIKIIETKEVPTYKWVTEKRCPTCGGCSECASGVQGHPMEAAPMNPAPAPTPVPVAPKMTRTAPQGNIPAGYHVGDEETSQDPIFQAFLKK